MSIIRDYKNWIISEENLQNDFTFEVSKFSSNMFPTFDDFRDAVKKAEILEVTAEIDLDITRRSRTRNREDLVDLIKTYQSYGTYRTEKTLDDLYHRIRNNMVMEMPIILLINNKLLEVLSGNTRMDVARHLGINPMVLLVKVRKDIIYFPKRILYDIPSNESIIKWYKDTKSYFDIMNHEEKLSIYKYQNSGYIQMNKYLDYNSKGNVPDDYTEHKLGEHDNIDWKTKEDIIDMSTYLCRNISNAPRPPCKMYVYRGFDLYNSETTVPLLVDTGRPLSTSINLSSAANFGFHIMAIEITEETVCLFMGAICDEDFTNEIEVILACGTKLIRISDEPTIKTSKDMNFSNDYEFFIWDYKIESQLYVQHD